MGAYKAMNELKTLKSLAGKHCIDIYRDLSELKAKDIGPAVHGAWLIGKEISMYIDNNPKG